MNLMKIKIEGRPGKIVKRGSTVITVMDVSRPPKLPRELPDASDLTMSYVTYLPEKLWRSVEATMADTSSTLTVYGDCYYDAELKALSVFVTNASASAPPPPKTTE
jgi:hypothetical protein